MTNSEQQELDARRSEIVADMTQLLSPQSKRGNFAGAR